MNNITIFFMSIIWISTIHCNSIALEVSKGSTPSTMDLVIMMPKDADKNTQTVVATIKKDLLFSEQFNPLIMQYDGDICNKEMHKKIKKIAGKNIPLMLFIEPHEAHMLSWRLYDTFQDVLLKGKKITKNKIIRVSGHRIADDVYTVLTGNSSFFSSRIAYCKDLKNKQGRVFRNIYVADYDGSHEELVIDHSTLMIAPRWDKHEKALYYSENTDKNMRLMKKTLKKSKAEDEIISTFDGINMQVSVSPSGQKKVYCASRGNGNCQIYLLENGHIKRCTKNTGNNVSPFFIDENRIGFCSDFQTGKPQIYIANLETNHLQRITPGGYCTSGSYNASTNQIAYHKMINGSLQIMLYDCQTKKHTQITFDKGSKQDSSWSPNGTHLLYTHETGNKSSLYMMNLLTHVTKKRGNDGDFYTCPDWSPCYDTFPVAT